MTGEDAMTECEPLQPWVDAALEEYKAHRAALLEALGTTQRTLAFGTTAIGILVAGAFNVWDSSDQLPATVLFLVAVPLVSVLVVVQWVGQMLLLDQRSHYLRALEREIRRAYSPLPSTLFTWQERSAELYRRSSPWWKPDRRWQLHAATPVFAVFALGSLVLGAFKGFDAAPVIVTITASVEFVVLAAVLIWHAREITTSFGDPADVEPSRGCDS